MANSLQNIFPKSVTKKEASDTGMAMTLICLLLGYFLKNPESSKLFYKLAIPVLVITMAVPMFYAHSRLAMLWLGLTTLLGMVVSRVLLSVVYFVFLLPVGVIRRLMGKDSLSLKQFKKGTASVMVTRDIEFTANDIKTPY